ncbi:hypothetical protein [Bacillus atrophaeus]|uniref:hypothetical protein n=1 Tax=Bacillus atrophaeus TaxID=1452 RepID=UPI002E1F0E63|nr:hypothetical protein [Bacillus atrophaeus]
MTPEEKMRIEIEVLEEQSHSLLNYNISLQKTIWSQAKQIKFLSICLIVAGAWIMLNSLLSIL